MAAPVSATVRRLQAPNSFCSRRRYGRPPTPPRRECISGGLCDCPCGQGWVSSATATATASASRRSPQQLQPPPLPLLPHGRWSCRPAPAPAPTPPPPARLPLSDPDSARPQSWLPRRAVTCGRPPPGLSAGPAFGGAVRPGRGTAQIPTARGPVADLAGAPRRRAGDGLFLWHHRCRRNGNMSFLEEALEFKLQPPEEKR